MKYLFIDMDGVIVDFYHPSGKIQLKEFDEGMFINKLPIKIMIDAIQKVFPSSEYQYIILSIAPQEWAIKEKNDWLDKYFNIPNRIISLYPMYDKGEIIYNFIKLNPSIDINNIYAIDDDLKQLKHMENQGINCIHPAHVLSMYESLK